MDNKIKWNIIGPEIKYDDFYYNIINLIKNEDISTILEIGASSGDGSTEAIISGCNNKDNVKIFSIEVCTERFINLKNRYSFNNFYPYNVSSININEFPNISEIVDFCNEEKTFMKKSSIETVLGWYNNDIEYIKQNNIQQDGIELIKKEHNINVFDLVLIDGSEFTGFKELQKVYGAKYILLDDINAFKNFKSNEYLLNSKEYVCINRNDKLRNGYSIFKRIF